MRKAYLILCLLLSIVFVLTTPSHIAAAKPTISLSPTSGYTGATVTIQGTNLQIVDASSFKWDDVVLTLPGAVVVGRTGTFSTTFDVPSDETAGVHNVIAAVYVPLVPGGKPALVTAASQFTVLHRTPIKPIFPVLPTLPTSPTPTVLPSPPIIPALASPNTTLIPTPITPSVIPFDPTIINLPSNPLSAPTDKATPTPSLIPSVPVAGQLSPANQNNPSPSIRTDAKEDSSVLGLPLFAIVVIIAVVIFGIIVLKKHILG